MAFFEYVIETPEGLKVRRPMPKKNIRGKEYTLATIYEDDFPWAKEIAEGLRDEGFSVVIKKQTKTIYELWCRQVQVAKVMKASKSIEA